MVTLKLNGPRRRESERFKHRSDTNSPSPIEPHPPTTMELQQETRRSSTKSISKASSPDSINVSGSGLRTMSAAPPVSAPSPPGDTIQVKHKTGLSRAIYDDGNSASPDVGPLYIHERVMSPPATKRSVSNRPSTNRNKGPALNASPAAVDHETVEADSPVVEYDFRHEVDHGEDVDDGRDTMWYKKSDKKIDDVITISSDDDKDDRNNEWDLNDRPWRQLDRNQRQAWEMMYCHVTDYPMQGDWAVTEAYQNEKDKEMSRYMEDFPIPQWVLPQHVALDALNRLQERTRWRSLGIRIYGRERIPEWMPGSTSSIQRIQAQSMPPPPPQHQGLPNSNIQQNYPQGVPQPPPQVLRSQPNAQPIPTYPNGVPIHSPMGGANIPSVPLSRMPSGPLQGMGQMHPPHMGQSPSGTALSVAIQPKRKSKTRKYEIQDADMSAGPTPTPPYAKREKPTGRITPGKSARRTKRHAEAEEFPWNRGLNFPEEVQLATWDDSIYSPETLNHMAAVREVNARVIERIDAAESERQRATRSKKKSGLPEGSSDTEQAKIGGRRKSSQKSAGAEGGSTGDPYHSGHFEFTPRDQPKIMMFGNKTPDEIMADVEEGKIDVKDCADLMICWNPGKKGLTGDIQQARFSIKDTVHTRQQLDQTPVLVKRAAERIVDFCPDMLWRGILLRIPSEAGYGNKWIRDRMCLNGNYCDKATITKRIGSALGQKQQQSALKRAKTIMDPVGFETAEDPSLEKMKAYAKSEEDYYNENVEDFGNYVAYFGYRTSHRSQLQVHQQAGVKRKAIALDGADDADGSATRKKVRSAGKPDAEIEELAKSLEAVDTSDDVETSAVEGDGSESEADSKADAVSVQSDTILDQLDED